MGDFLHFRSAAELGYVVVAMAELAIRYRDGPGTVRAGNALGAARGGPR